MDERAESVSILWRIPRIGTAWRILLHRVQESTMFIETEGESFGKECYRCLEHSDKTKEEGGYKMTDREKAIIMAYTGVCTLIGNKFSIFHEYVEDILCRPVQTIEMGMESVADEIKEKARPDFLKLCEEDQEPCGDCISREKALQIIRAWFDREATPSDLKNEIEQLPPVTPQPKMGHWIYTGDYITDGMLKCSECGFEHDVSEMFSYCPNCGVKMQEVEE